MDKVFDMKMLEVLTRANNVLQGIVQIDLAVHPVENQVRCLAICALDIRLERRIGKRLAGT